MPKAGQPTVVILLLPRKKSGKSEELSRWLTSLFFFLDIVGSFDKFRSPNPPHRYLDKLWITFLCTLSSHLSQSNQQF